MFIDTSLWKSNMSKNKQADDPFTLHVMGNIEPEVFKTFNLLQIEAIKHAVAASKPHKQHPVDVRFCLPLFFIKLYFVLLIGRDKRSNTRNKEEARKHKATTASIATSLYLFVCAIFPVVFLLLYLVKSWMGIDLMPDRHLSDLFS